MYDCTHMQLNTDKSIKIRAYCQYIIQQFVIGAHTHTDQSIRFQFPLYMLFSLPIFSTFLMPGTRKVYFYMGSFILQILYYVNQYDNAFCGVGT